MLQLSQCQIAAIGSGTKKCLQEQGYSVDICPPLQFNSEGLLAELPFEKVSGKKIVIITGKGGRALLKNALKERGASVTEVAVYQRQKPVIDSEALDKIIKEKIDFVTCTSAEGLQNIWEFCTTLQQKWLQATPLLTSSERIKNVAERLGIQQTMLAENASNDAILRALIRYKEINNVNRKANP